MMQASAYGRIGRDPQSITTKSGKPMASVSLAVSIDEPDTPPLWFQVLAFGKVAEDLLRHQKGDLISVAGRVQRNSYTTSQGEKREQMQIIADSLISARTSRPGGARKQADDRQAPAQRQPARDDLNDDIPF